MSRWFRFYDTVLDDPKVQRLADHLFRGWVNILCLASKSNGVLPPLRDVSFCLRVTDDDAEDLIKSLLDIGLLEYRDGELTPHNWNQRQYVDATNAERQKRFREKNKIQKTDEVVTKNNAVTNIKITPLESESDTDTDTDKKNKKKIRSRPLAEFDRFWDIYPRKTAKGAAEKAWEKACGLTDPEKIIAAAERATWPTDPQFIPHASTWLNQKRWLDEAPKRTLTLAEQYALKAVLTAEPEADLDDDLLMYRSE